MERLKGRLVYDGRTEGLKDGLEYQIESSNLIKEDILNNFDVLIRILEDLRDTDASEAIKSLGFLKNRESVIKRMTENIFNLYDNLERSNKDISELKNMIDNV